VNRASRTRTFALAVLAATASGCALLDSQDVPERRAPIQTVPVPPAATAPVASKPEVATPSRPVRAPRRRDDDRPDTYVVQKGDTLFGIALEFGYDWRDLAAVNQLADPSRILVGQRLTLGVPEEPATVKPIAATNDVRGEALPGQSTEATSLPPAPSSEPAVAKPAGPARAADGVPILDSPRARVLPYSDKALAELEGTDSKAAGKPSAASAPASAATSTATTSKPAPSPPATAPASRPTPGGTTPPKPELPATTAATATPGAAVADPSSTKPPTPAPTETRPGDRVAAVMDPDAGTDWVWPTRGTLAYRFGASGQLRGVGIAGKLGQPVSAAAPGRVVYAGGGVRGYGNMIIVKHDDAWFSVYAHNAELLVKDGEAVRRGQRIATMGSSEATRTALHFEIRKFGKPVDPLAQLPGGNPPL
jgi:lipoprotein NlpD